MYHPLLLERQRLNLSEVDGDLDYVVAALYAYQYVVGYSGRRDEDVVVAVAKDLGYSSRDLGVVETRVDAPVDFLVEEMDDSVAREMLEAHVVEDDAVVVFLIEFLEVVNVTHQKGILEVGQGPLGFPCPSLPKDKPFLGPVGPRSPQHGAGGRLRGVVHTRRAGAPPAGPPTPTHPTASLRTTRALESIFVAHYNHMTDGERSVAP